MLYVKKLNLYSWPDLDKIHPLKANQVQFLTGTSSAASYLDGMLEPISTIYNSKQPKEILAVVEGLLYRLIILLSFKNYVTASNQTMEKRHAKDGKLDLTFQVFVSISALFLNIQYDL